jgi:hypothetical protein
MKRGRLFLASALGQFRKNDYLCGKKKKRAMPDGRRPLLGRLVTVIAGMHHTEATEQKKQ